MNDPFAYNLGLKAPTANRKEAHFTFHTQRAVQSAMVHILVVFLILLTNYLRKCET